MTKLREEMQRARSGHEGWQRDIFDDLGETIEEVA
jgi:hypothetical protein